MNWDRRRETWRVVEKSERKVSKSYKERNCREIEKSEREIGFGFNRGSLMVWGCELVHLNPVRPKRRFIWVGNPKIKILDFKFFGLHHSNPYFYFNTKTSPTLPNIQLPTPRPYICLLVQFLKKNVLACSFSEGHTKTCDEKHVIQGNGKKTISHETC